MALPLVSINASPRLTAEACHSLFELEAHKPKARLLAVCTGRSAERDEASHACEDSM